MDLREEIKTTSSLDLLKKAANSSLWYIRNDVAENPNSTKEILNTLIERGSKLVYVSIIERSDFDDDLFDKIFEKLDATDYDVYSELASHSHSPEHLHKLMCVRAPSVKAALVRNPNLSDKDFKELSKSKSVVILSAIASSPRLDDEIAERYKSINNWKIRYWLFKNKNTPSQILKYIIDTEPENFRKEQWKNQRPDVDFSMLDNFENIIDKM